MMLADPFWLVLAIPLAMSFWLWPPASRLLLALRIVVIALVLLAICGWSVVLPSRSGAVLVIADRSLSMPHGSEAAQKESVELLQRAMRPGDMLGVVAFGEQAAIEQSPQAGKFAGFTAEVGSEASNLADAIDLALSLSDKNESSRLLVLSDGLWTGRDIAAAAARAAAAGVPCDYRSMERSKAGDLAIERIQGPGSVVGCEAFMITAWVLSPVAQNVSYELLRGSTIISQGTQSVPAGSSRLMFRDKAPKDGICEYQLRIKADAADPVPENNRARLLVGVRNAKTLLCVSQSGNSSLARLLAQGGVPVQSIAAGQCQWTLEELSGYSAVLLENTPAGSVGHVGMKNLGQWVTQSGGGLMFTGGRNSYGPGGYYKSPLESVMPVSMELRREHRKMSLAMVVVLDRSGSMAVPSSDGRPKMELADLATAEVVDMLGPTDQFGCIAVDSAPHEIVPLSDVTNKGEMRDKSLRIDSMGGGIFIYEALSAAARMIAPAKAGTKHIILFADAADSEQPEDYRTLVAKCVAAGITISVVGLGTEHDCDAELLKDIAKRGGGQCMFTNIAQELPRLFAQDTFLIARNAFLDEPVAVRPTGGLLSITRQTLGAFPQIGGYNLCYTRPRANLSLVSEDEYRAPIVASWQAGLGRVLCYTGEADGKYVGPLARWKNCGLFLTSLARWAAGKQEDIGRGVVATQELRDGVCRVELHLDPSRESDPFQRQPEVSILSAQPGDAAAHRSVPLQWSSADTLLAEVPIQGSQTVLVTVTAPGIGQSAMPPACLAYSAEFLPQSAGKGAAALEQLARSTGGCERLNLADIWSDIPRKPRLVSLTPYLLLLAVLVFLVEIAHRRMQLLTFGGVILKRLPKPSLPQVLPARKRLLKNLQPESPPVAEQLETPAPVEQPPSEPSGIADAIRNAQNRARQRTGQQLGRTGISRTGTKFAAASVNWPTNRKRAGDWAMANSKTGDVPPGWDYNPAGWLQRLPIVGLALVGFVIATYLALFQYGAVPTIWEPFFGDGSRQILRSDISTAFERYTGFPVTDAALGALGYLMDAITGLIGGSRRWRTMPWIVVLFGILVGPLGAVSIMLVIFQPVLLNTWCTLCLATAAISILMIGPALDEVLASLQHMKRATRRDGSFWRTFWGLEV